MVLFNMYGVFFLRFLESRNYKIQIVAHVGGKSAALRPPRRSHENLEEVP